MWRAGRKTVLRIQNKQSKAIIRKKDTQLCDCDTEPQQKRGLKTAGLVCGGLLCGAGGFTYVYARRNPDFRSNVEKYIPGSKTVFFYTIGSTENSFTDPFEKPLPKFEPNTKLPINELQEKKPETPNQEWNDKVNEISEVAKPLTDSSLNGSKLPVKEVDQLNENQQALDDLCLGEVARNTSVVTIDKKEEKMQNLENSNIPTTLDVKNHVLSNQLAKPVACLNTAQEPKIVEEKIVTTSQIGAGEKPIDQESATASQEIDLETKLEFEASSAILDELLSCYSVTSANAILLSNAAADATALHSSLLRTAIDDHSASPEEKSLQWNDVSKALDMKEKKLEEANLFYEKAEEELAKLKQVLQGMNTKNSLVKDKVEEICLSCSSMSHDLLLAKSKVTVTLSDAEILQKYQSSLEEAKENLRRDFVLPEAKVMEEWRRESQRLKSREDIEALRNMQIKVEELKQKLLDERDVAMKRFEENVELIRKETEEKMRKSAEEEKKKVLEETRLFYEMELSETKSSLENEMEKRLKEQSAIHAEHLAQALTFMDKQASEKYKNALQKEIEEQWATFQKKFEEQRSLHESETSMLRDQYQADLGIALAKIEGIRKALEGRAMIESETRKAQELSLACDSLLISIKHGDNGEPMPLAPQLHNVRQVYSEHPAITVLSNALPEEAQSRGVYPEDVIRKTFSEVAKQCRKVSMVDESRNSLWVYFLSWMKSWMTLGNASLRPPQFIAVEELNVFDIISYATYCIEHGDMEQAVRFLNQLRGEARNVADWWIREARLYLETKQSIDALSAVSNSIVIGAQLE